MAIQYECIILITINMQDESIKEKLIPPFQEDTSPSPYVGYQKSNAKLNTSDHQESDYLGGVSLQYRSEPNIEGQCILKQIVPIKKSIPRFMLYILLNIILPGIPLLITFWYPKFKKRGYYQECDVKDASHLYVINHDDQPTYPKKYQAQHHFNSTQKSQVFYFINRYLKYIIIRSQVSPASYNYFGEYLQIKSSGIVSLKEYAVDNLRQSYGIGAMIIDKKSIPKLFVEEIMRPLYIFIVLSCLLWLYESYYYYTIMIFVSAVGGVVTSLYQTYLLNEKIHNMAYYETNVNILREGNIAIRSSRQIVPGDIVFIKESMKIPFDAILLSGSALCNECSITGESVPVIKKAEDVKKQQQLKNSLIYEGSVLIQVNAKLKFGKTFSDLEKYREAYGLPVLVIRTNFITLKGQLIRIISFPSVKQNIFEKESIKFLLFLFVMSLLSYMILTIKLWNYADTLDIFVKLGDLITVTVPPGLPISMTFGIIFALEKLKNKKIFCTSPNKIITGGMTDMICFDKTGTLTQDFMDFYCLVPINEQKDDFDDAIINYGGQIPGNYSNKQTLKYALTNMAVNHNIVKLEQTGEYVGDPMEIKMLEFGGFSLKHIVHNNEEVDKIDEYSAKQLFQSERGHNGAIIKNFEFSSELFRMSTIAQSNLTGNDYYIYSKGSPEQMHLIMNQSTVPSNYFQVLKRYTSCGYRVLAIGSRKVEKQELKDDRIDLQNNLIFEGFEVFENKLKEETCGALKELTDAQIPSVMITGDNALTACSIAYKCGISDDQKVTFIITFERDKYCYKLEKFRDDFHINSSESEAYECKNASQIMDKVSHEKYQLCFTGSAFNYMFDGNFSEIPETEQQLFWKASVFARAKPNDKTKIITLYQHFNKNVAMCGDGANDCGALKQASIGLSLSQAEASISAPFTSQVTNIGSMVQLIKQCQSGLATNFSVFNIMALYSLIQYNTVLVCQFFFAFPSDFSYLYWDVACNFVFFMTFGYTGTSKKLSKLKPSYSLFSVSNITAVLVAFLIQLIGQIFMILALTYIYADDVGYYSGITFETFKANDDQFVLDSHEGNLLFLFSNYIYISTVLAFSISKPWREDFWKNKLLMGVLFLVLTYTTMITIWKQSRLQIFEIIHMDYQPLNNFVCLTGYAFAIVIYIIQKYLIQPYFNRLKARHPEKKYI